MDSVDATWTRPGEVLTLDAGWTDSVVVHLTVDANLWDQTRPQLFVRMDAGTVRVDGALVLDRTGPWLWGRHQQVDLPHEAAVDGLVEILVEPLPTTHFWILPAARVDALHVGDAAALETLEYQTFGAPKDVSTIASTYAIPWLLGVALLWLWWHRRDALLLWFAIGILAMASANGLTHLAQSELIPYVPGFAVAATLVFATAGAGYSGFLARTFSPDLRWVTVGVPSLVFAIYIVRGIAPTMWGPGTLETLLYLLLLGIGLWRRQRGVGWFIFALAFFVAGELVVLAVRTEMMDDAWLYWKAALQAMAVALTVFAMVMLLIDRLVRNLEAAERFVPREYLAAIGASDLSDARPGSGVTRNMVVLFTDIRGFTRLSEQLGPEQTAKAVDAVLGVQARAVDEAGGFVDKYIGDAVMALFLDPADAIRAAEACVAGVRSLDLDVGIGVGIHMGALRLGTVGTEHRMSCTAIGDTVNLAARIEGLTRVFGNDILLSEQVARAAKIPYRRMERVAVKGRSAPVVVVEPGPAPAGWDQAFEAWSEGRFAEAARGFRPLHEGLADRCEQLHAHPPPDWDGVTRMSTK